MKWKITEQGPRVVIEVWRADGGDGLYKAWLTGQAGRCLLGTLIPEGGRLYLRRTLTIDSLKRQGLWPATGVEEELVCSFRERAPSVEWEDEVLRSCARNLPRHMVQRTGEGFALSFPFDPHAPFPLTSVFCFASVENGRLIFSFRTGGWPYISRMSGKDREEIKA